MPKSVCVVVGVGPGNGAAYATKFAKEGYQVALLARSGDFINKLAGELDHAKAYPCDVSDNQSIHKAFSQIQQDMGDIDVVIYNAGSGTWGNVETITSEQFEMSFRINTAGLLTVSQHVIPAMKQKGQGTIIVTGATASKRGNVMTAAFAPAKAAQRSLCESMAKYLGPQGIHVSLIIIDGVVDLPRTRENMPDKPDSFFIKPDAVAQTAFWLTKQDPSTWSFEMEIRPFAEKW